RGPLADPQSAPAARGAGLGPVVGHHPGPDRAQLRPRALRSRARQGMAPTAGATSADLAQPACLKRGLRPRSVAPEISAPHRTCPDTAPCSPALIPAWAITLAHLAISDLMVAPSSAGDDPTGSRPSCAKRGCRSGSLSTARVARCTLARIGSGVPAGASSANHEVASNPGKPDSAMVGRSGTLGDRVSDVTARPRSLPSRTSGRSEPEFPQTMVTRPPITA